MSKTARNPFTYADIPLPSPGAVLLLIGVRRERLKV